MSRKVIHDDLPSYADKKPLRGELNYLVMFDDSNYQQKSNDFHDFHDLKVFILEILGQGTYNIRSVLNAVTDQKGVSESVARDVLHEMLSRGRIILDNQWKLRVPARYTGTIVGPSFNQEMKNRFMEYVDRLRVLVYEKIYPRHSAGCCLHIIVDDGNIDPKSIEICRKAATVSGHEDCIEAINIISKLSLKQRAFALKMRWCENCKDYSLYVHCGMDGCIQKTMPVTISFRC